MNVAVVYFSLEGNTKYVAEKIASELNADLIPLIPVKEYPTGKVSKYFWGGKSTTFREKPKLETYQFDHQKYDLIVLGTPIWAGTFAPPLRTFVRDNQMTGKNVALFASCSGGSTDKCFADLTKEIAGCSVISTLRLVDPVKNARLETDEKIADFCKRL